MEILITIAYLFAIRLVFFDFKWLKMNLVWGLVLLGAYLSAAMTEVVFLGQYTPYSKAAFVQRYVIPMAPEFGGPVVDVHVAPGAEVKKGDPLYTMEKDTFQDKVEELEAELVLAQQGIRELEAQLEGAAARIIHQSEKLAQADVNIEVAKAQLATAKAQEEFDKQEYDAQSKLAEDQFAAALRADRAYQVYQIAQDRTLAAANDLLVARMVADDDSKLVEAEAEYQAIKQKLAAMVDGEHAQVRKVEAQLAAARYRLKERTVVAPSDGQVVNLQLRPGTQVRLKTPVVTFLSADEPWIVAKIRQKGAQHVRIGDEGEVAFEMYPGKVFPAKVVQTLIGDGNAQFSPSGTLPKQQQIHVGEHFFVVMQLTDPDPAYPLHFGAAAIASIYTGAAADILKVLRKIEIRSESYLNYFYNPF